MGERERETREDFGDLWCLGLLFSQNGKFRNIYVGNKGFGLKGNDPRVENLDLTH